MNFVLNFTDSYLYKHYANTAAAQTSKLIYSLNNRNCTTILSTINYTALHEQMISQFNFSFLPVILNLLKLNFPLNFRRATK